MTKDEIIHMAREADSYADKHGPSAWRYPDEFAAFRDERFAALIASRVAADEREACAKVCDSHALAEGVPGAPTWSEACAAAIRARGETSSRGQV